LKQTLRLLNEFDLPTIRDWRNHPKISRFMFSQRLIAEDEHQRWFENCLRNPAKQLFIYEVNGLKQGFMQFQERLAGSGVLEWGFYISPHAEKGVGTSMAALALDKAFGELTAIKVYGEVLEYNVPSIKLHERMQFKLEGVLRQHHLLNDHYFDICCFGLLKSEWIKSKSRVIS
jgi:UDP-4-amino-4,6-dideoxy-N-acetyl-beta-L-altrosamine N-acetyltransferase